MTAEDAQPHTNRYAVDPDIDVHVPRERRELRQHPAAVLVAISSGGVLGALARYGVGQALPHETATWPWSTWLINVTGSALIGVLMVLITDIWPAQRLLRPFLGVGILGGYTTFSTAMTDVQQMIAAGHGALGLAYWLATLAGALLAVTLASLVARYALNTIRTQRRPS